MLIRLLKRAMLAGVIAASPAVSAAQEVTRGTGAVFRWLDKVSGAAIDVELQPGVETSQGRLTITLTQCRYPTEDPSSNAFAYLTVYDRLYPDTAVFQGWMIADSPALNAMDHSRYDLWLLRCTTS